MIHVSIVGIKWIVHNSQLKIPRVEQVVSTPLRIIGTLLDAYLSVA